MNGLAETAVPRSEVALAVLPPLPPPPPSPSPTHTPYAILTAKTNIVAEPAGPAGGDGMSSRTRQTEQVQRVCCRGAGGVLRPLFGGQGPSHGRHRQRLRRPAHHLGSDYRWRGCHLSLFSIPPRFCFASAHECVSGPVARLKLQGAVSPARIGKPRSLTAIGFTFNFACVCFRQRSGAARLHPPGLALPAARLVAVSDLNHFRLV